jgi:hypothetical protein
MLRPNHVIMQHSCSVYDVRFRPNHASWPSTKSKSNPSYHSFKTRPDPAGRPGAGTGPGLMKNQLGIWPGKTRLTRDP